jgi:hypothetical protein|tara:strand:+ start:2622 stop:3461 length:840 start_codon:yes stop_codon:yes gene_type:complete
MSELNQEEVSNPYNMNKAWHTPDGPKSDTADGMFFERPKQQATSEEAPDAVENEQAPKKRTNYKKRYDDLKRHYDQKLSEFKQKEQELTAMAKNAQPQYEAPKTPEELEKFKTEYPDLYDTVESVAYLRSSEQVNQLQEQLQMIQQREATALKREAEADLISRHPDFEDIRGSDNFHKWADDQPEQIQDWIYKNPDNAMLASKAIDLFKLETGLSTQTKSQPRKPQGSAADIVSTKTTTVDAQQPKIWTEREIAAMSLDTFDKYEDEINLAVTEGRVVK